MFKDGLGGKIMAEFCAFRAKAYSFLTDDYSGDDYEKSNNDDKRIQTFDKVTTFPYGTNVFKVCENEMLSKNKWCAN